MSALQTTTSVMSNTDTLKTMLGLPIALGLSKNFDPEALKSGDITQLNNWRSGENPSIYIKWVPDELTEKDAGDLFSQYGPVSRIEFVPKMKNGQKIGRMLFVHFERFIDCRFANDIAYLHPNPASLDFLATNRYGIMKKYELMCCINMRPIPKVEYSASQLSDMFERLNSRVTVAMDSMKGAMDSMKAEIEQLRLENQLLRNAVPNENTEK